MKSRENRYAETLKATGARSSSDQRPLQQQNLLNECKKITNKTIHDAIKETREPSFG